MTEQIARQNGYSFTGHYKRSKDEVQPRLQELKKKGYKAVICTVPDSPLSRGTIGRGYSIFAEERYFVDQQIEDTKKKLDAIDSRKQGALRRYNEEIAKIDNEQEELKELLNKLQSKNLEVI